MEKAQFSPDGREILWIDNHILSACDAQSGSQLRALSQLGDRVDWFCFTPDGGRIATGSARDGSVRIWDASTYQLLKEIPIIDIQMSDKFSLLRFYFSPDNKRLITFFEGKAGSEQSVSVWDVETGNLLAGPWDQAGIFGSAMFSPDNTRILIMNDGVSIVDFSPPSSGAPAWLVLLAEAIGGEIVDNQGVIQPTKLDRAQTLKQLRKMLALEDDGDPWVQWGRWLLADRATRTVSPLSTLSIPEYLDQKISQCSENSLRDAENIAYGKSAVLQRIAAAKSSLALTNKPAIDIKTKFQP